MATGPGFERGSSGPQPGTTTTAKALTCCRSHAGRLISSRRYSFSEGRTSIPGHMLNPMIDGLQLAGTGMISTA